MSKMKIILFLSITSFLLHSLESYKIHNVKEGETLWRISKTYNIPIETLCKINKITDITKIKKGDKIKIPIEDKEIKTSIDKTKKTYVNYNLPFKGNIKPLVTSNFRGLIIFTDENIENRNINVIDDGVVVHVDNLKGYGLTLFVKHNNDLISIYSGLDRTYIKKGDKVKKLQLIGISGIISRYSKYGIIFSIQRDGNYLKYDFEENKFYYIDEK